MAPLIFLDESASTNDEIVSFLPYPDENFFAICTFNQTQGKGQYGNSWLSPKNLNIAYTISFPSDLINLPNNLFNYHTANVFAGFIAILTRAKTEIKWPNDIIVHEKKVAGILIEKKMVNRKPYFVIGIGLNVLQQNFEHLPKAGSLLTQTNLEFDLRTTAESLHQFVTENILKIEDDVLEKFNDNLFRKNKISVFENDKKRQNGIIKSVDSNGFLWVELEHDGLQKFYHKEIQLLY